jgi:hypothetical protein
MFFTTDVFLVIIFFNVTFLNPQKTNENRCEYDPSEDYCKWSVVWENINTYLGSYSSNSEAKRKSNILTFVFQTDVILINYFIYLFMVYLTTLSAAQTE